MKLTSNILYTLLMHPGKKRMKRRKRKMRKRTKKRKTERSKEEEEDVRAGGRGR